MKSCGSCCTRSTQRGTEMNPILQELNCRLEKGEITDEEIDELLAAFDNILKALEDVSKACGEFGE